MAGFILRAQFLQTSVHSLPNVQSPSDQMGVSDLNKLHEGLLLKELPFEAAITILSFS